MGLHAEPRAAAVVWGVAAITSCLATIAHLPEVTGSFVAPFVRTAAAPAARSATGRGRMWLAAGVLACTLLGSVGASAQSQRETERKLQQLRDELKTISADRRELEGNAALLRNSYARPTRKWPRPHAP